MQNSCTCISVYDICESRDNRSFVTGSCYFDQKNLRIFNEKKNIMYDQYEKFCIKLKRLKVLRKKKKL